MYRSSIFSGFIRDTVVLGERIPVNREGATVWLTNYSSQTRRVYVDQSNGGVVWTALTLSGTSTVVPYGVTWIAFTPNGDPTHIRLRLDAQADQDGVFFRLMTAAPVAAYLNMV